MAKESIVLFHSHNYAIWADSALKKESIDHKMMPIPRQLSSDCGYCIRIKSDDAELVEKILHVKNIEYDRIEAAL